MASASLRIKLQLVARIAALLGIALVLMELSGSPRTSHASGSTFFFSTGLPDGKMAMLSRPDTVPPETEAADDFVLSSSTTLTDATFTGLVPASTAISQVVVEIYRVFPLDSTNPPDGRVPTRVNSPSDVAFASRDSTAGELTFTATTIGSFSALNSVVSGINAIPFQTTGGEGPVSGNELQVNVTFTTPLHLPADHYFLVPQVRLSSGNFLWLSAPKPIVAPGTPFSPDLQAWIRNTGLEPDWLRVGTDIVGGVTPPTFNAAFSLTGVVDVAPAITSANTSTFTAGTFGTFTVTATGVPTPTMTETGSLPSGVTFNAVTGVLSGIPGAATAGTYSITFTASNGVLPDAVQAFTLNVNPAPVAPAITSSNLATFIVSAPGNFLVTATGTPAPSLSEAGALPGGVTFNPATGALSGTPLVGTQGIYPLTFTASNGVAPNAVQNFTLIVNPSCVGQKVCTQIPVPVVLPPRLTKAFGPLPPKLTVLSVGTSVGLTFTITNPNASTLSGVGLNDALPAGMLVSIPSGQTGSCGGGTITASAGSGAVSLAGATLGPNATCTFTVNVTGTTAGMKVNTAAATSNEGGTGPSATASVTFG